MARSRIPTDVDLPMTPSRERICASLNVGTTLYGGFGIFTRWNGLSTVICSATAQLQKALRARRYELMLCPERPRLRGGDGRVPPPGFQLLEVENKMSYLLNTNAGNIGRKSGYLQEFPEKIESGKVEIDSIGALAFGPGTEPVTLD